MTNEHVGKIFQLVREIDPRIWMVVGTEPSPSNKKSDRIKLIICPLFILKPAELVSDDRGQPQLDMYVEIASNFGEQYFVGCAHTYRLTPHQLFKQISPYFWDRYSLTVEEVVAKVKEKFKARDEIHQNALLRGEDTQGRGTYSRYVDRYRAEGLRVQAVFRYFDEQIGRDRPVSDWL